ncbi:eukaryotic translation initiation factor 4 gamma 1-like [Siniperca chuatsi]|uniref:eukaryotic translation initiation factor 4 gamma 1-like n=1 Tax=Siniperca chuatsi TaxID=119488 RepID=UPI001CE0B448|nr:eukaryotic translation initiation factor 4 gamma 1-like [Siniperca chuatsi]
MRRFRKQSSTVNSFFQFFLISISFLNVSPNKASLWFSSLQVKVPTTANSTVSVSFQTLLMRRCQAEFQRNHLRDDVFEERQRRLEAAKNEEELERLKEKLDDAKASRRSVNNIKFIGELFKSKILSEAVVHSCIQRLLKNRNEESLECLCELFGIIGKELEVATAKRVLDIIQGFHRDEGHSGSETEKLVA